MVTVKMENAHAWMIINSRRTALLKDVSMIFGHESFVCAYIFLYFLFDLKEPFCHKCTMWNFSLLFSHLKNLVKWSKYEIEFFLNFYYYFFWKYYCLKLIFALIAEKGRKNFFLNTFKKILRVKTFKKCWRRKKLFELF